MQARFGPVAAEPVDIAADPGPAGFDAAMISVGGLVSVQPGRVPEEQGHIGEQGFLVGLQRQEIVRALGYDRLCNAVLTAHGVNGDQRAFQFQPPQQARYGTDFVFLFVARFCPGTNL